MLVPWIIREACLNTLFLVWKKLKLKNVGSNK